MVLDPIDALFAGFSAAAEVRRAFAAMVRELRGLGATTLLAAERGGEGGYVARYGAEEFAVDNVVILRNDLDVAYRRRTVEVLKLRGAEHREGGVPVCDRPEGRDRDRAVLDHRGATRRGYREDVAWGARA